MEARMKRMLKKTLGFLAEKIFYPLFMGTAVIIIDIIFPDILKKNK